MQDIGKFILSLIRLLFISIGYLLALPTAIVKAIVFHTNGFSNRILSDVYTMDAILGEATVDEGKSFIPKSPCCGDLIKAKLENGEPKYFYCGNCHSQVTKDDIEKQRFNK